MQIEIKEDIKLLPYEKRCIFLRLLKIFSTWHYWFIFPVFEFTDSNSRTTLSADQAELNEIEEFEHQSPMEKWGVRGAAFALVFALLFLWIWYR